MEEIDCSIWETPGFRVEELDVVAEKPGEVGIVG